MSNLALLPSRASTKKSKRRWNPKQAPRGARQLRQAWFHYNGITPESILGYSPQLLQLAEELKYIHWPYLLRDYVKDKDVVDLGCGKSLHGIGYLMVGAKTYTGLDPIVELDRDCFKDARKRGASEMRPIGWTPAKVAKRLPRIRYRKSFIQNLEPDELWDVLVLHNVTEHLMEIEKVFAEIPKHLRPGGKVIFSHPNFYSWNGHHMAPRYIDQIDPSNAEQKRYMDWAHLTFDPTWPDLIIRYQNRIRLADLKALTEKYFDIETWRPAKAVEREGLLRWDPAILQKHPEFTEEELLTQRVFCVGVRK